MRKLPYWCIADRYPAFYDTESATAIEQTAKLWQGVRTLIEEYNKFVDEWNKHIDEFEQGIIKDNEAFRVALRQEFQNFIDTVELKLTEFENYIKGDLISLCRSIFEGIVNSGELNELFGQYLNELNTKIDGMLVNVTNLQADVTNLQADVTKIDGMQGSITNLQTDINNINGNIGNINENISNLTKVELKEINDTTVSEENTFVIRNKDYETLDEPILPSYHKCLTEINIKKDANELAGNLLSVATFNMHTHNSYRMRNIEAGLNNAVANNIIAYMGAEVLSLNEAYNSEEYVPILDTFSNDIYTDSSFITTLENLGYKGNNYGNALLTTKTLLSKGGGLFSESINEKRGYAYIKFSINNKTASVYTIHLDYDEPYTVSQINELYTIITADTSDYKIIMGDFNVNIADNSIKEYFNSFINAGYHFVNNGVEKTMNYPTTHVSADDILCSSNIEVVNYGVVDTSFIKIENAYDHRPVYATLKFN